MIRALWDRLRCEALALLARVVKPKRGWGRPQEAPPKPVAGDVMHPVSRLYP